MNGAPNRYFEFGRYLLLPEERRLLCDSQPITLPAKAFDTLVILVEHSGHIVKKETLIERVWPDAFVEENNLSQYVSLLRRTLKNGSNGVSYIETVRGYGYRFTAEVRGVTDDASGLLVHKRSRTHISVREQSVDKLTHSEVELTENNRTQNAPETAGAARPVFVGASSPRGLLIAVSAILVMTVCFAAVYFANQPPTSDAGKGMMGASPGSRPLSGNPGAMAAYLRGRDLWNKRTRNDMMQAQKEFQSALTLDPNFAAAYSGLADCLLLGGSLPGSVDTAESLAKRALEIDDSSAEAHTSLAYYESAVGWDWPTAEVEFQRAIALNPQYATARHWHAYHLASFGRMEEALSEIREAHRLDPSSLIIATDVGHVLYLSKRYDEAIAQYLTVLEIDPDFSKAHYRLAETYVQKQRWNDALFELEEVNRLTKERTPAFEAYIMALANRRGDALRILAQLKPDAHIMKRALPIAMIYAGLGDKDAALTWLEESLEYHDGGLALLKVEPIFENLRDSPRYAKILRRMSLE